jgi:hypothetical protein
VSAGPHFPDQRAALLLGAALLIAGTYCIYDAYDGRGRARPYWLHFLPGI